MRMLIPCNRGHEPFADRLQNRQPFRTAAASRGYAVGASHLLLPKDRGYWYSYFGYLPMDQGAGLEDRDYEVYSYRTIIAWHSRSLGWQCPKVSYSQGTSRVQNLLRAAIDHLAVTT